MTENTSQTRKHFFSNSLANYIFPLRDSVIVVSIGGVGPVAAAAVCFVSSLSTERELQRRPKATCEQNEERKREFEESNESVGALELFQDSER